MRDWSELRDPLSLICNRASSFQDLVALGGVCASWRSVAVKVNQGMDIPPKPWLMLSEKVLEDSTEFYSPMNDRICSFHIPE